MIKPTISFTAALIFSPVSLFLLFTFKYLIFYLCVHGNVQGRQGFPSRTHKAVEKAGSDKEARQANEAATCALLRIQGQTGLRYSACDDKEGRQKAPDAPQGEEAEEHGALLHDKTEQAVDSGKAGSKEIHESRSFEFI